ncbi:NLI interacting factor [Macrophomina phaseolina MS6]|uniref:NLI interacting factor n=1 Tax=Macrophomina phaseolina (strain MS6) TaxID=1126212 RepID=K2S3R6_MACPH|nr:NLI interacting factor [Macrophomina phaseolina MS6]
MEASTFLPLPRYSTTTTCLSLHQPSASFDTDQTLVAQMGKKKNNAKKLNQQQPAAAATPAAGSPLPHRPTPTQAPFASGAAPAKSQPAQGRKSKSQKKRAQRKTRRERQALAGQPGARPPPASAPGSEDPIAYFTSGHGHGEGKGDDQSSQGSFVGQPLLEALDTVQMDGVPTGADDNPHGYNLQNATWDWNKFNGGINATDNAAHANEAGDWTSSKSSAPFSSQEAGTSQAYIAAAPDAMSAYAQYAYSAPPLIYGQSPGWNQYQQQSNTFHQTGYYTTQQGLGGPHYIHGHTNSFTPNSPAAVLNRGLATKAGMKSGLVSPERTSESEGGESVGNKQVRRSKRLAAKEIFPDSQQMVSSPSNWRQRSTSPNKGKYPSKPNPHPEYIKDASKPTKPLPTPQTLLIVIDLNGTLVHRPSRKNSSRIIVRPYVQAFLNYLLVNHRVMVWSSARPENVDKMCSQLFSPHHRSQLVAEWGRDTLDLTPEQYNQKVQVYKQLWKVWHVAAEQKWHPRHQSGRRFHQNNTFLIDDSLLKANSEPHNLIQVEEFEGKPDQMQTDVLRQVVGYLEAARWVNNVSAWVNHDGQRFEYGKGWDYQWPEGTLPGAVPDGSPARDLSGAGFESWRQSLGRHT